LNISPFIVVGGFVAIVVKSSFSVAGVAAEDSVK
jgi:hypothetical protein